MKIILEVEQIDYAGIAAKALPLVRDKLKGMEGTMAKMLGGIASMPEPVVRATINAMPQDTKDQMVTYLINHNKDKIISAAQSFAEKQGFELNISRVSVEQ